MLYQFVLAHRDELVTRARALVLARAAPNPLPLELEEGVPLFLGHLADSLRTGGVRSPEQENDRRDVAMRHGGSLLRRGFTVAQVVHDYGAVCQAVTELAMELLEPIEASEFASLNLYLDEAIADSVTEFLRVREQMLEVRKREWLGEFAHEMRNLVSTAMLSFEVIQEGKVPLKGSSAAVHARTLRALQVLIEGSLSETRIGSGLVHHETLQLAELVGEMEATAVRDAANHNLALTILPVSPQLAVFADRQLLASIIANLLQNAFKFSHRGGRVELRVGTAADSPGVVRIEVQDQCGGLVDGAAERMFDPFERRSSDRTGLGLGLAISRKAAEANGGLLSVRDLPGEGCVFFLDLPAPAA